VELVSVAIVSTSSWIWHHASVARKITRVGRLRKAWQRCSVGIVRAVGELVGSQRPGRIYAGRTEELAVSGNVELRVGADGKLVCHCNTSGSHIAAIKISICKLIEHRVHGDVLVLQTGSRSLREWRALVLGVMVGALSVHV
jgi:hypothetical protein